MENYDKPLERPLPLDRPDTGLQPELRPLNGERPGSGKLVGDLGPDALSDPRTTLHQITPADGADGLPDGWPEYTPESTLRGSDAKENNTDAGRYTWGGDAEAGDQGASLIPAWVANMYARQNGEPSAIDPGADDANQQPPGAEDTTVTAPGDELALRSGGGLPDRLDVNWRQALERLSGRLRGDSDPQGDGSEDIQAEIPAPADDATGQDLVLSGWYVGDSIETVMPGDGAKTNEGKKGEQNHPAADDASNVGDATGQDLVLSYGGVLDVLARTAAEAEDDATDGEPAEPEGEGSDPANDLVVMQSGAVPAAPEKAETEQDETAKNEAAAQQSKEQEQTATDAAEAAQREKAAADLAAQERETAAAKVQEVIAQVESARQGQEAAVVAAGSGQTVSAADQAADYTPPAEPVATTEAPISDMVDVPPEAPTSQVFEGPDSAEYGVMVGSEWVPVPPDATPEQVEAAVDAAREDQRRRQANQFADHAEAYRQQAQQQEETAANDSTADPLFDNPFFDPTVGQHRPGETNRPPEAAKPADSGNAGSGDRAGEGNEKGGEHSEGSGSGFGGGEKENENSIKPSAAKQGNKFRENPPFSEPRWMGPVAGTGRLVAGLFGLAVFSPGVKITGVKRTGLFTFEVTVEGQTTPLTVKAVGETMAALFARAGASQRH